MIRASNELSILLPQFTFSMRSCDSSPLTCVCVCVCLSHACRLSKRNQSDEQRSTQFRWTLRRKPTRWWWKRWVRREGKREPRASPIFPPSFTVHRGCNCYCASDLYRRLSTKFDTQVAAAADDTHRICGVCDVYQRGNAAATIEPQFNFFRVLLVLWFYVPCNPCLCEWRVCVRVSDVRVSDVCVCEWCGCVRARARVCEWRVWKL